MASITVPTERKKNAFEDFLSGTDPVQEAAPAPLPKPELEPQAVEPAPTGNLFEQFLSSAPPSTATVLETAVPRKPDEAARHRKISDDTGLPVETVAVDPDGAEQAVKKKKILDDLTDAAATDAFMSVPQNAAEAHDDVTNLVAAEKAAKELTFTGAFSNGVDLLQGLGYRFLEASGEALGSEELEAFGQEGAEANFAEVSAGGHKQRFQDIGNDPEKLLLWMKQTSGEQIPLMAPSIVGGTVGMVVGGVIGSIAGPAGTLLGAAIGNRLGAFIPSFILGVGETQNAIKSKDINVEAPGFAFGSGALIGLLDSALPGKVGSQLLKAFGRETTEEVLQKVAVRVMARNAVVQGGKGMVLEGVTEAVQEVISEAAAASATGQEIDVAGLTDQVIEAFAAGAFTGGAVSGVTSASSDIIKSRRVKTAMDAIQKHATESKLEERSPDKAAELRTAQMAEAGVESVFISTEALIQYAQQHPDGVVAALQALGVSDQLDFNALNATGGITQVEIPASVFSAEVLGTEGYKILSSHIAIERDTPSVSSATMQVFSQEEIDTLLQEELEAYDAHDALKEKVQETITKAAADPTSAAAVIDAAGVEVEAIINDLINKASEAKADVETTINEGRVALLDDEIAALDTEIAALDESLQDKAEQNQTLPKSKQLATKQDQNRLDKLVEQRNAKVDESAAIVVPEIVGAEAAPTLEGTKVVDKDGEPLTVFHHGSFTRDQDGAIHFGTEQAARERAFGKPVDDVIAGLVVEQDQDSGRWFWRTEDGLDSFDFNENGFDTEAQARSDGIADASIRGENLELDVGDLGDTTVARLSIQNPKRMRDQGKDWTAAIAQAKEEGHDGIVYINQFEDKGSTSYIVFDQSQVFIEGEVAAPKTDTRKIKTKAQNLKNLAVKITQEAVKSARDGFRAGIKAGKTLVQAKKDINAALDTAVKGLDITDAQLDKLHQRINAATTLPGLRKVTDAVQSRAMVLIDRGRKKSLKTAIKAVLKKNQPKPSKKRKGTLTPEIHDTLDGLPKLLNMSAEEAATELDRRTADPTKIPTSLQKIENMALALSANPDSVDVTQLENLLIGINEAVTLGKFTNKNNAMAIAAHEAATKQKFQDLLNPVISETPKLDKDGEPVLDDEGQPVMIVERAPKGGALADLGLKLESALLGQSGAWWNILLRVMRSSDKNAVESMVTELGLFEESRDNTAGRQKMIGRFNELFLKALGLKNDSSALKLMQKMSSDKVKVGTFVHANNERKTITMTTAELIQRVAELQNPDVNKQSRHPEGNAYTDEIILALREKLKENEQANRVVPVMTQFYNEYYPRINKTYAAAEGINLPREELYVPISRIGDTETDEFLKSILFRGNVSGGALNTRTGSHKALRTRNAFSVMQSHVAEMEYYIANHSKIRLLNAVFDGQTLSQIEALYGKGALTVMQSWLTYFQKKGAMEATAGEAFYIQMMRNFSVGQLGLSGVITIKQFMSIPAYAEKVGTVDFLAGIAHLIAHPKMAWAVLNKSRQFNTRGDRRDQDFVDLTADQFGSRVLNILGRNPRFAALLTLNIRVGDKGALAIGGYAHYYAMVKQLRKAGVPKKEAETKALASMDQVTVRTQQSPDPDQQSQYQRSNGFGRLLAQFMSSANALTRAEYAAGVEFARGRSSAKDFAKAMVIYHVIIPQMIQLAANAGNWDDEDQYRALAFGGANGLLMIGDVIEATISAIFGFEDIWDPEIRHPLQVFLDVIEFASKLDEFEWGEVFDGVAAVDNALKGVTGITGIGFSKLFNATRGVTRAIDGEVPEGLALMLGYSPYSIEQNFGP